MKAGTSKKNTPGPIVYVAFGLGVGYCALIGLIAFNTIAPRTPRIPFF
jgi:hypothetical protein